MTAIKLSDLLCEFLKLHGTSYVFAVTGGSILHPLHSAHKTGLSVLYTHHEQAASFAADAATRLTLRPQACFVTTGPAGTNALTGVLESWQDSIPQIIVSGQARLADLTDKTTVRQIGSQHCDIVAIVENVTKKVLQITSADDAVDKILSTITACNMPGERMGPVWIDIPLDLQWANIEIDKLPEELYNDYIQNLKNEYLPSTINTSCERILHGNLQHLMHSLREAKRPLFVIGSGINASPYKNALINTLLEKSIPLVFTWGTIDSLRYDHILNFGLLGVNGQRGANIAAYLSDCIVGLGTHFSDQITGRIKEDFAPNAIKFMLDIDPLELAHVEKHVNGIHFDLNYDSCHLLDLLHAIPNKDSTGSDSNKLLIKSLNYVQGSNLNEAYSSSQLLSKLYQDVFNLAPRDTIFVADGGGNTFFGSLQNSQPTKSHKIITSVKTGCMGSGLPQAIGAACASPEAKVCCFIGDGSLQFNVQELMTISHNYLDVTIVVISNGGYQAIKDTQNSYFDSVTFGVDSSSGLGIPNYALISKGYNIKYECIPLDSSALRNSLLRSLGSGPNILEIFVPENVPMFPVLGKKTRYLSKRSVPPIANMEPELPKNILDQLFSICEW